jgi:hypothetical protein
MNHLKNYKQKRAAPPAPLIIAPCVEEPQEIQGSASQQTLQLPQGPQAPRGPRSMASSRPKITPEEQTFPISSFTPPPAPKTQKKSSGANRFRTNEDGKPIPDEKYPVSPTEESPSIQAMRHRLGTLNSVAPASDGPVLERPTQRPIGPRPPPFPVHSSYSAPAQTGATRQSTGLPRLQVVGPSSTAASNVIEDPFYSPAVRKRDFSMKGLKGRAPKTDVFMGQPARATKFLRTLIEKSTEGRTAARAGSRQSIPRLRSVYGGAGQSMAPQRENVPIHRAAPPTATPPTTPRRINFRDVSPSGFVTPDAAPQSSNATQTPFDMSPAKKRERRASESDLNLKDMVKEVDQDLTPRAPAGFLKRHRSLT